MDTEKRQVFEKGPQSVTSFKEETKIETLTDESDRISASYIESQEQPQLQRTLKARHLAVKS